MTDSAQTPETNTSTTPAGLAKRLEALKAAATAARERMGTEVVIVGAPPTVLEAYLDGALLFGLLQVAIAESEGTVGAAGLASVADDVTIEQFASEDVQPRTLLRLAHSFQSKTGIDEKLVIPAILHDLDRELQVSERIAAMLSETLNTVQTFTGEPSAIEVTHSSAEIAARFKALLAHGRKVGITFSESVPGNDLPPALQEALLFAFSRLNFVERIGQHTAGLLESFGLDEDSFDLGAAGEKLLAGLDEIVGKDAADKARAAIDHATAGAAALNGLWKGIDVVNSVVHEAETYLTVVVNAHLVEEFTLHFHRVKGRSERAVLALKAHLPLSGASHGLQQRVTMALSDAQNAEMLLEKLEKTINGIRAMSGRNDDSDGDLLSALFEMARELVSTLHEQIGIDESVAIPSMAIDLDRTFAHLDEIVGRIEGCASELDER